MTKLISEPLYQIAYNFKVIEKMVEDGEISTEDIKDQLEAFDGEFDQKANSICMMIKNIDPVTDNISKEIKRLQDRKKTLETRQTFFKKYLCENMDKINKSKVEGDIFSVTLVNGREKVIIDNEDDLSDKYIEIETKTTVNKKALLSDLQAQKQNLLDNPDYDADNALIEGAHIERGDKYILIK